MAKNSGLSREFEKYPGGIYSCCVRVSIFIVAAKRHAVRASQSLRMKTSPNYNLHYFYRYC